MPVLPGRPGRPVPAEPIDSEPTVMVDVNGVPSGASKEVHSAILKALDAHVSGVANKAAFRLKFGLVTADGEVF